MEGINEAEGEEGEDILKRSATAFAAHSLVEDLRCRGFVDRLSAADIQSMSTQSGRPGEAAGGRPTSMVVAQDSVAPAQFTLQDSTETSNSLGATSKSSKIPSSVVDFAAELLHGGERANIVVRIRSAKVAFVEVISWDFVTEMTDLLSRTHYTVWIPVLAQYLW
ncbi:hypothetical protein C8R44DRAFT_742754 [Mycena epipterygia]|nr:hypothetical protein C8R44DRAFT_742754 [Mycena epipterygia]